MMDSTITAGFLDKLRLETSQLHKQLESLSISKAIISNDITVDVYAKYLSLMKDVVRDVENKIFPLISHAISNSDSRRKLSFIVNDLTVLGCNSAEIKTDFDADFDVPFAMGIVYVMEGSTLGGRVILKNIEKNLGYNANNGAQYFAGYKENTGLFWKSFLSDFIQFEENNNCSDAVIAGANFAFNTIYTHFSKNE